MIRAYFGNCIIIMMSLALGVGSAPNQARADIIPKSWICAARLIGAGGFRNALGSKSETREFFNWFSSQVLEQPTPALHKNGEIRTAQAKATDEIKAKLAKRIRGIDKGYLEEAKKQDELAHDPTDRSDEVGVANRDMFSDRPLDKEDFAVGYLTKGKDAILSQLRSEEEVYKKGRSAAGVFHAVFAVAIPIAVTAVIVANIADLRALVLAFQALDAHSIVTHGIRLAIENGLIAPVAYRWLKTQRFTPASESNVIEEWLQNAPIGDWFYDSVNGELHPSFALMAQNGVVHEDPFVGQFNTEFRKIGLPWLGYVMKLKSVWMLTDRVIYIDTDPATGEAFPVMATYIRSSRERPKGPESVSQSIGDRLRDLVATPELATDPVRGLRRY